MVTKQPDYFEAVLKPLAASLATQRPDKVQYVWDTFIRTLVTYSPRRDKQSNLFSREEGRGGSQSNGQHTHAAPTAHTMTETFAEWAAPNVHQCGNRRLGTGHAEALWDRQATVEHCKVWRDAPALNTTRARK